MLPLFCFFTQWASALSKELQKHMYFEFGSIEDHFKYRQAVIEAYPCGNYPVFEGYDHMQYQIRDPKGFAEMLAFIAEQDLSLIHI